MIFNNHEKNKKLIELCKANLSNRQIAIKLDMKHSTLCAWKRKLRDKGIDLPALSGRPRFTSIVKIENIDEE